MTDNLNEAGAGPKQQFPMNHGFLLALVIGMGVLIVVGVVALGVAMMQRGASKAENQPVAVPTAVVAGSEAASVNFGDHDIALPAGFELDSFHGDGNRLLLRLSNGRGETAIWVLDMLSGQAIGRYTLKTAD